jgi:hypothetical protein
LSLLSFRPTTRPEGITETFARAKHCRIERIVSQGHASLPYICCG